MSTLGAAVPPKATRGSLIDRLAVPAVALASVVIAVCVYGVGARDDPYITYWAAEQLAKTGAIVNINGAHLEQSSSLAHVLLLAALYFITRAPLPVLAYVVGLASLVATVLLGARLARRINSSSGLAGALVLGLAFPLVYWSTGGLETDLAAAGVIWFLLALDSWLTAATPSSRTGMSLVASTLLVTTVRPDTMLVAAAISALIAGVAMLQALTHRRVAWIPSVDAQRAGVALGVVVIVFSVLALARVVLFGTWLPQPELAKAGGLSWLATGIAYLYRCFPPWLWILILLLFGVALVRSLRRGSIAGCLAAATFLAGLVLIAFSRGDWMGGDRLLLPYLAPALVLMAAESTGFRLPWRTTALGAFLAVECATIVLFANGAAWLAPEFTTLQITDSSSSAAAFGSPFGGTWTSTGATVSDLPWYDSWDFVSTRDSVFLAAATPVVRRLIEASHGTPVTIASDQAGMVFYAWANDFPNKIHFIDTKSIATNYFSRCSGLEQSFAGDLMTLEHWVHVAGKCAPPLPDLYFTLGPRTTTSPPSAEYHVVSFITISYHRRGLTTTTPLYESEYLAQRNGWNP